MFFHVFSSFFFKVKVCALPPPPPISDMHFASGLMARLGLNCNFVENHVSKPENHWPGSCDNDVWLCVITASGKGELQTLHSKALTDRALITAITAAVS